MLLISNQHGQHILGSVNIYIYKWVESNDQKFKVYCIILLIIQLSAHSNDWYLNGTRSGKDIRAFIVV